MPVLNIEGLGSCDVEAGTRLVNAVEACGMDIGHRCGGNARCTTCRVQFHAGEPETMTKAEYDKLKDRNLLGETRLACQIVVAEGMHVTALMRASEMGWSDPGPAPEAVVQPEAAWFPKADLEEE